MTRIKVLILALLATLPLLIGPNGLALPRYSNSSLGPMNSASTIATLHDSNSGARGPSDYQSSHAPAAGFSPRASPTPLELPSFTSKTFTENNGTVSSSASVEAAGTVTVSGRFRFCENGGTSASNCPQRDVRRASLELWDAGNGSASNPDRLLATTNSIENGTFKFPAVSNTDTVGTLDIYIKVFVENSAVLLRYVYNGTVYRWLASTQIFSNIPDGSDTVGTQIIPWNTANATAIYDTMLKGYDYALARGHTHSQTTVYWPFTGSATLGDGYSITIGQFDAYDEDVILHEYTHSILYQEYGAFIPGAGGVHGWTQCVNATLGFSEGFPDFIGPVANFETGYGDAYYPKDTFYKDLYHVNATYDLISDLEAGTPSALGDCAEASIAYILWDMYDSVNEAGDGLAAGIAPIWATFSHTITALGHKPYNIHDFWDGWLEVCQTRTDCGTSPTAWAIFNAHGITDTTPPSGSISINSGATYTNTLSVTLGLTYSDALSRVYQVRYSNDGVFDTEPWETPVATKAWTIASGDGTKTVYFQVKDNAGVNSVFSDTIILDTTAPSGSVSINNGATYTSTLSVTLTLTYSDGLSGVSSVRYTNDGVFDTEPWVTPTPTKTWTLTSGDGTKTVYFQVKDNAGVTSGAFSDTIILDTTPPSSSVSTLAAYSNPTFTVSWTGTDNLSGIANYDIQHRDATANGTWTNLATSTTLTSTSFMGTRGHLYEFRSRGTDALSNVEAYPSSPDTSTTVPLVLTADFSYAPTTPEQFDTITFTSTTSGGGLPLSYQWTFGDGATSSAGPVVSHYYSTAGTFTATLVVSSPEGQSVTVSKQVQVIVAFFATFTYSPSQPLVGQVVTITAQGSGGQPPYTYSWFFREDGSTATGNPVYRTYTTAGTYYIALTGRDSLGHTSGIMQPITIGTPPPSVTFSYSPSSPTTNAPVQFSAVVSGGQPAFNYSWSFGDGSPAVTENPAFHVYTIRGAYTVSVTVTDTIGRTATSSQTVTVQPKPLVATFTVSPSPTAGSTVTFTGSATGGTQPYTYAWNFGDGQTGTGNPASHIYSFAGTYTVRLTVTDVDGLVSTVPVPVNVAIVTSYTYTPTSPYKGQSITFTGTASLGFSPYMFSWNFGDGTTATGSQVTHIYSNSGTYTVTLTVTDSNGNSGASSTNIYVACGCGGGGGGSVAYGTLITMADGSRVPVQNLKVGDQMLGYDTTTSQFTVATVTQLTVVDTSNMLVINTEAGTPFRVDANPAQTLWTKRSDGSIAWVSVTDLKVGDYLFQETSGWVKITSINFAPQGHHVMYDIVSTMPYFASGYLDPVYKL